jgi:hypothetical protein
MNLEKAPASAALKRPALRAAAARLAPSYYLSSPPVHGRRRILLSIRKIRVLSYRL